MRHLRWLVAVKVDCRRRHGLILISILLLIVYREFYAFP
jgi:hypothetical protein